MESAIKWICLGARTDINFAYARSQLNSDETIILTFDGKVGIVKKNSQERAVKDEYQTESN
jgi:hypothetical protein